TTVIQYAKGFRNGSLQADATNDVRTETMYDRQGRAVMTKDGSGHRVYTEYDAADHAVHTWYTLDLGTGGEVTVHGHYSYDALGRQLTSETTRVTSSGATSYDATEAVRYNAF